jgi:hypothetical protein
MTASDKHNQSSEDDAHNLLPPSLEAALPRLYATEKIAEKKKIVYAKFFAPNTFWTWFVLEGEWSPNHTDFIFFGLVHGFEKEYSYFSLNELKSITNPLFQIERDLYFNSAPLPDCVDNT